MTRVLCYVARSHGLAVLRHLLTNGRYEVAAVVTHARSPKTEDPDRGDFADFADFIALAHKYGVPVFVVDSKREDLDAIRYLRELDADVLLACNWRRYFTPGHLRLAKHGGVNLHRGQLPAFAGAHPVARALALGRTEHCFAAHVITAEVDGGPVLVERWVKGYTFDEAMDALEDVAPELACEAIERLVAREAAE